MRGTFDRHSDLDMAVDGLDPQRFFRGYGQASALAELPVPLDLVDTAELRGTIRRRLEEEGVDV